MNFPFQIPGFSESEPRPSSRQEILDAWSEMFAAVDNLAVAAELSEPGVTTEFDAPATTPQPEALPNNVVDVTARIAERTNLGRGTVVAAAYEEQRDVDRHSAEVNNALAEVYRIHDGRSGSSHAT